MASVVDELNALLAKERGILEAVEELIEEISDTEPDIAQTCEGIVESARWSCAGLSRRISQMQEIPTLDVLGLADISDKLDTVSKIKAICTQQKQNQDRARHLLKAPEADTETRELLQEMLQINAEAQNWCGGVLSQWKRD